MCDDDHRLSAVKAVDRIHDRLLRISVQRRCGLVKNQDLRIVIQSSRNPETLSLSAGYPDTPVSYRGIQPFRQLLHKFFQLRFLKDLPDARIIDLIRIDSESDIVPYGFVDQLDGLRNISYLGKPCRIMIKNIHPVAGDRSCLRVQETEQNVYDR